MAQVKLEMTDSTEVQLTSQCWVVLTRIEDINNSCNSLHQIKHEDNSEFVLIGSKMHEDCNIYCHLKHNNL